MGGRSNLIKIFASVALSFAVLIASPASAQFSESYNFLKAVRDSDGDKVTKSLRDSGSTLINTRDFSTGEGALHIVVKRRDLTWLKFLLGNEANPNLRDSAGESPLVEAAQIGFIEGATTLLQNNAQVNLANNRGETALIIATQQRNLPLVRLLLANGADPRQADHVAGKSALDYAAEDPRAATVLKMIKESATTVKPKPKMSGPGL